MGSLRLLIIALGLGAGQGADEPEIVKFEKCPEAVRKTFQAEAKGARIETVGKEGGDGDAMYWADVHLSGRSYSIGVAGDGTLSEMNLAADADEVPFAKCPAPVQATLRHEAWGAKIETLAKDIKYGETIYETTVEHRGKTYEIVVASDGTLVEKTLVIDEEDVEFEKCPEAVKKALKDHAHGGKIGPITRTTGLGPPTFQADIAIEGKDYLVEVSDRGVLISKLLQWRE